MSVIEPARKGISGQLGFTIGNVNLILEHVSNGVPLRVAAAAVGIHYTTVHRWQARGRKALDLATKEELNATEEAYARFAMSIDRARANAIAERIAQIDVAGHEGDWRASGWWLERQVPQEFGLVNRTELTGNDGGPIQVSQADIMKEAHRIVSESMNELPGSSE